MKLSAKQLHALTITFIRTTKERSEAATQVKWDALRPHRDAFLISPEWIAVLPTIGAIGESINRMLYSPSPPNKFDRYRDIASRIAERHGVQLYDEIPEYENVENAIVLSALGSSTVDDIMQMLEKKFS